MTSARDPDCFHSVLDGPAVEVRIKASRFFGRVFRAESEESAEAQLAALRKHYHDATHHCSALRLSPPGAALERSDDDGEPSGTAGPPILRAIQREELFDVFVVVTRYYGGTKLGTGGLLRAYAEAARDALDAAPRRTVWQERILEVKCSYPDLGAVEAQLAKASEVIHGVERSFDPDPRLSVRIRRSHAERFAAAVIEVSAGRASIE